jgi:hypothetical protein
VPNKKWRDFLALSNYAALKNCGDELSNIKRENAQHLLINPPKAVPN